MSVIAYERLRPEVTAYDGAVERLCRLSEVLGYVKALSPEFDEAHLATIHDHKGVMRLTWRAPPTPWTQDCFGRAWDVQCEPPENVEHRMLGETDYDYRDRIEIRRHP